MAGRETNLMSNISPCHLEGEKLVGVTSLLSNTGTGVVRV